MIRRILNSIAQPEPAPPWSILYATAAAFGAFAAVIIGTAISTIFGEVTPFTTALAWIMGLALITIYVTFMRHRTAADVQAMRLAQPVPRWALIVLMSFGVGVVFDLLGRFVTDTPSVVAEFAPLFNAGAGSVSENLTTWVMLGLLLVVFQPVGEGLIFRGIAYPALRAALGPGQGFLMVALWHGIFHLVVYSTPGSGPFSTWWYTLILPILCGLHIGVVRAVTGSTRASIFAQMGLGLFFVVQALTLAG